MSRIHRVAVWGCGLTILVGVQMFTDKGQRDIAAEQYGLAEHELVVMDACLSGLRTTRQGFVDQRDEGRGCGCVAAYSNVTPSEADLYGDLTRDLLRTANQARRDENRFEAYLEKRVETYQGRTTGFTVARIWADLIEAFATCQNRNWVPPQRQAET